MNIKTIPVFGSSFFPLAVSIARTSHAIHLVANGGQQIVLFIASGDPVFEP